MFNFGNKKEKTIPEANETKKLITVSDLVPFLLSEEEKDSIVLGKTSDGAIFIQFKDEKISSFVKQWFAVLKMKVNEEISESFYKSFTTELSKEFTTQKAEKQKNDTSVIKNLNDEIIKINGEVYKKM